MRSARASPSSMPPSSDGKQERQHKLTKRGRLASRKMRSARSRPGSKPSSSDEARAAARVDQAKTTGVRRDVISTSTPTARGDRQAVRRERQLVNQARTAGITRDAISTRAPKLNAAVKRWEAREAARVDQPSEDGWRHARCDQHDHAQAQGHRQAMRQERQPELTKRGRLASRWMRQASPSLRPQSSIEARAAALVDQARAAGITRDAINTSTPKLDAAVKH